MADRVLLTGSDGYVGSVLRAALEDAGMAVASLDTAFYGPIPPLLYRDIRDTNFVLSGDAMAHLAGLSNDPLGEINEALTYEINYAATVKIARQAKAAGLRRFIFASSQSIYGLSETDELLTEDAPKNPLTAYARSKWLAEQAIMELADDQFCVVALRPATVFGWSPRLRSDIVFNNFLAQAYTTGRIEVRGDGSEWRPVVHIRDLCSAFIACLTAPAEVVNGKAYNVGMDNYSVAMLAKTAASICKASITYGERSSDTRSYQTDGSRFQNDLKPTWWRSLKAGGRDMRAKFAETNFTAEDLGRKTNRLAQLKWLMESGKLDSELRWR
jgi:nucleoside-diphosphate-sugar epimerase